MTKENNVVDYFYALIVDGNQVANSDPLGTKEEALYHAYTAFSSGIYTNEISVTVKLVLRRWIKVFNQFGVCVGLEEDPTFEEAIY